MTIDMTDRKGALLALGRRVANLQTVQSILVDGGYSGQAFAQAVKELFGNRNSTPVLQFIHLAFLVLLLKRSGTGS